MHQDTGLLQQMGLLPVLYMMTHGYNQLVVEKLGLLDGGHFDLTQATEQLPTPVTPSPESSPPAKLGGGYF